MSQQEVERAGVVAEVAEGRMRQRRAAEVLGLSCRQIKRLVRTWRAEGAMGLRSKRRGRPSNHRHPDSLRKQVLALAAERYEGFCGFRSIRYSIPAQAGTAFRSKPV